MKKLIILLLLSVWTFGQQNPCTLTFDGVDYTSIDLPCADFQDLELTQVSNGVFTDSNSDHVLQHTKVDGQATTALSSTTFNTLESTGLQAFISTLLTGGSAEITIGNQEEGSTVTGKRSASTSRLTPIRFSHVYRNNHALSITRASNNQLYSDAYTAGDITTLTRGHSRIRLSYGRWIARSTEINAPTTGVTNYRVYTAESNETIVNPSGGNFRLQIQPQQGLLLLSQQLASGVTVSGTPLTISNGYYYIYAFPGTHSVSITDPSGTRTFDVPVQAGVQYNLANSYGVSLTESTGDGWYNVDEEDNDLNSYGFSVVNSVVDRVYTGHYHTFFLTRNYGRDYERSATNGVLHNSIRYPYYIGNSRYFKFDRFDSTSGLATISIYDSFTQVITTKTIARSNERTSNDIYESRLRDWESTSLPTRVNKLVIDISTISDHRGYDVATLNPLTVLPRIDDAYDFNRWRSLGIYNRSNTGTCYTEEINDFELVTAQSWSYINYRSRSNPELRVAVWVRGTYLNPVFRMEKAILGNRRDIQEVEDGIITRSWFYEQAAYRVGAEFNQVTTINECP